MFCKFEHHPDRPGWSRCSKCRKALPHPHPDQIKSSCQNADGSRAFSGDPVPINEGPCAHQGEELRRELCRSCTGKVSLRVFACAIHEECSWSRKAKGVTLCLYCPDHQAAEV